MATILLRETGTSTGSTVKGAPLTNAELDTTIDNINKIISGDTQGLTANGTVLNAASKLYLDGSFAGNTYLTESSDNVIDFVAGTVNTLRLNAVGATVTGNLVVTGALSAARVNGNTISTGTGTLTLGAGKVLTASNTLTLTGTDGTTMTFPTTSATIARTDAANTFTGTQTIGALVATTVNGNTITTGTGVLTIAASKTFTSSNTLTLAGTDGSTLSIGTGGTLGTSAYITLGANVGTWLATPSSANLAAVVTDETGTGALVFANTPTLVAPVLGVATATSINGNTITTGTGTLTLGAGSTLATSATNSITLTSTGATNVTLPTTGTLATQGYVDGLVVGLLDDRGSYDASVNTFPASGGSGTAGAILKGDLWYISVAGTLGGTAVGIGDSVRALTDTPSQTAGNWSALESNIGYVPANRDAANVFTGVQTMTSPAITTPAFTGAFSGAYSLGGTPTINVAAAVGGAWTAAATWTLPAFTLGGTVSGGGNQINNVVIGTITPLAGAFTTVSATGVISATTASSGFTAGVAAGFGYYGNFGATSFMQMYGATGASPYAIRFVVNALERALIDTTGLSIRAADKLYLDGAGSGLSGGDTYITESSANVLDLYAGGVRGIRSTSGALTLGIDGSYSHTLNGTVAQTTRNSIIAFNITGATTGWSGYRIANTGCALLMGVASSTGTLFTGSTAYSAGIGTEGALPLEFATNSVVRAVLSAAGNLAIGSTAKLYLDGVAAAGNTYLVESAADVLDAYVGGVNTLKLTAVLTTIATAVSVPDLSAAVIDKTVFPGVIVDTFIYDTAKDSDGGAWRKRCSHTSWENETLSGNWLGSAANEAGARAIVGATTNSYYYDTTAAAFYTLNAGSGKTVTYRGNVRQFPAQVLITVEAARVILWDLTQAGAPMWMVFSSAGLDSMTSVAGVNGQIWMGGNDATIYSRLVFAGFIADKFVIDLQGYSTGRGWEGRVSVRNSGAFADRVNRLPVIVNSHTNDVAMTVLPNAPVDVATGLPVPTIAVATNGGVSVIKDSGTVVSSSATDPLTSVAITPLGDLFVGYISSNAVRYARNIVSLSASFSLSLYYVSSIPAHSNTTEAPNKILHADKSSKVAVGFPSKLALLKENPASVAAGMVAYITKDYNSGWQVGAIKGAWLADTVAENPLTGAEMVTNGDFGTDTTGWTGVSATLSVVSGAMRITATAGSPQARLAAFTTVVGKTYVLKAKLATLSVGGKNVWLAQGPTTAINESSTNMGSTTGLYQLTFVASSTTTYVGFTGASSWAAAEYFDVDAVSCRLADVDRSVKAKGLQAFGSLTKAAVASGAQLMGYSGFSAANYLEQPYNSDLDFGTGDFCIMGWVSYTTYGANFRLLDRSAAAYANAYIAIELNANTGVLSAYTRDSGGVTTANLTSSIALASGAMTLVALVRRSGVVEWHINAVAAGTVANTNNLTNTSAYLRVGKKGSAPDEPWSYGSFALLRFAATAPTAEQIKHIYETERPMFEANAQCCIAGTSNAVTALAYDDETDLLHVGTSYGRSTFKGLVRTASEATAVGSITALSASGGIIAQSGTSGADVYIPAMSLREELARKAEQTAKLGAVLEPRWFTATSSQVAFPMPMGWKPKFVYRNSQLIRPDANDYSDTFDGFIWTSTLIDACTTGDFICIMGVRTNG
jgi:hypothetical protein